MIYQAPRNDRRDWSRILLCMSGDGKSLPLSRLVEPRRTLYGGFLVQPQKFEPGSGGSITGDSSATFSPHSQPSIVGVNWYFQPARSIRSVSR